MEAATPTRHAQGRWPLWCSAFVIAGLGLVPVANMVTHGRSVPWWGGAVHSWLVWIFLIGTVALGLARFAPAASETILGLADRALHVLPRRYFAILAGVVAGMLSLYFGAELYHHHPVSGDEFTQLWQARILSFGRLAARTPAHGEFFSTTMTLDVGGRWFGQFPIGGPALLHLGTVLGAPWLINPILTAITVVALYWFASGIGDERFARRAALLIALSPFILFMGGSMMNHVGALTAVSCALAALVQWYDARSTRSSMRAAAGIGLAIGCAATIRPYDALLVALAIGAFQVRHVMRRRALRSSLVVQVAAGAIPVALLLVVNYRTVGNATSFAYDVLNGIGHRPGFHVGPFGDAHTPERGIYNISSYLMQLNGVLLGWPVPALLLVCAALLLQKVVSAWDKLLLLLLGTFLVGYGAYWAESYFVGPRFLFTMAPVLLLFIARLPDTLRESARTPMLRTAAGLLLPLWLLATWGTPRAWTLTHAYRFRPTHAPDVLREVRRPGLTNALVFINDGWHERLSARVRQLGVAPMTASQLVASRDACAIQTMLDSLDVRSHVEAPKSSDVVATLEHMPPAVPVRSSAGDERIALTPNRPLTATCSDELARRAVHDVGLAELLPHVQLDANGALAGPVIFARDFGAQNERLRDEFGDRTWYVARVNKDGERVTVALEPYDPGAARAAEGNAGRR